MYHNSPEYKELKQLSARICTVCREMTAGMKEALLNKNEKAAEIVISQDEELNDYSLKSDAEKSLHCIGRAAAICVTSFQLSRPLPTLNASAITANTSAAVC